MTGLVIVLLLVIAALLGFIILPPIWREWRDRISPVGRILRGKSDAMMQAHGDVPYRGFR